MSLDPLTQPLLGMVVLLTLVVATAALIAWATIRTSRRGPLEESPLGWVRLLLSFGALGLLPVWGITTSFVLYTEYELEFPFLGRAALVSAVLVLEGGGLVLALVLAVRGALRLVGLVERRRARLRYEALVGEDAALRDDAWERAVLEVAEE